MAQIAAVVEKVKQFKETLPAQPNKAEEMRALAEALGANQRKSEALEALKAQVLELQAKLEAAAANPATVDAIWAKWSADGGDVGKVAFGPADYRLDSENKRSYTTHAPLRAALLWALGPLLSRPATAPPVPPPLPPRAVTTGNRTRAMQFNVAEMQLETVANHPCKGTTLPKDFNLEVLVRTTCMQKGYQLRSNLKNPEIYKNYNVLNPEDFKALLTAYVQAHGDVRAENQSLARRATFDATATLYVVGDVHSGITALVGFLTRLRDDGVLGNDGQLAATARVIFLGDLVDRGVWGAEVLYVALQLWEKNRDKVFVLRGNHENHSQHEEYGFGAELDAFNDEAIRQLVKQMCERLPEVLFATVRTERFVFCHGGIPHYADSSPVAFFDGGDGFFNTTEGATTSNPHADSQWQWNDFDLSEDATTRSRRDGNKGTMFVIGRSATAKFKTQHKVRQIVRGHEDTNSLRLEYVTTTSEFTINASTATNKLPPDFDKLVDAADVITTSIAYPAKIPSTTTPLFFVLITNKGTD